MASKSAPKPTDPVKTSAATTGTNVSTAIANAIMGNVNEFTPDGSTTVGRTGEYTWTDPYTKQTYTVPTFTRNTTLSPEQQAIKAQQNAADLNLATLGKDLSGTLGSQLTGNFKLGNEAVEGRLFDLGRQRLDPMFAQSDEALRTRLANQGIKAGTEAYDREMTLENQRKNDAYNQLLLQGRGQASQELLTEDNQRINQISALLSGGQVSQPNFMGTNIPQIPTTNNANIIGNYDQQRLAAWQAQQAQMGNILGGLFSMGGSIIASDRRVKKNVRKVGKTDKGLNLFTYNYKWEPDGSTKHLGVMAQDVARKKPEAVVQTRGGMFAVDYDMALA